MTNDKLLSIMVLNYRRLEYTKQTIECLMKKTTVPHELILIDNSIPETNDTDGRGKAVREYLDMVVGNKHTQNIVRVYNKKNLGVAGGRNEGLRVATGEYLFNVDDDVLVPDNYDKQLIDVCDKVPKLGITGINVEPNKYPIVEIGGIKIQYKKIGNLGGAALCIPRRIFKIIGYYGFGRGSIYGHEDSFVRSKLDILGLVSAYIPGRGIHLDKDADLKYRMIKNQAHEKGSIQLKELSKSVLEMRKTKNVYTPYIKPEDYHPVDETIFINDLIKKDKI